MICKTSYMSIIYFCLLLKFSLNLTTNNKNNKILAEINKVELQNSADDDYKIIANMHVNPISVNLKKSTESNSFKNQSIELNGNNKINYEIITTDENDLNNSKIINFFKKIPNFIILVSIVIFVTIMLILSILYSKNRNFNKNNEENKSSSDLEKPDSSDKSKSTKHKSNSKLKFLKKIKKKSKDFLEKKEVYAETFDKSSIFEDIFNKYNSQNTMDIIKESFDESFSSGGNSFYLGSNISAIKIE